MEEFGEKVVLHIPLSRYENGELVSLEIGEIIDELVVDMGIESCYATEVKSYYKGRIYPELLITVFGSQSESIIDTFRKWIVKHSETLGQESYAIELQNRLIILDDE